TAGLLAAPLRRTRRVRDLRGAFFRHALFFECFVLLLVLDVCLACGHLASFDRPTVERRLLIVSPMPGGAKQGASCETPLPRAIRAATRSLQDRDLFKKARSSVGLARVRPPSERGRLGLRRQS